MKRVYTAESLVQVVHVRNLLQSEGIRTELRNERLGGAVGEIPFLEAWPELWVAELEFDRAQELIELELHSHGLEEPEWTCTGCGERVEGQFGECWKCGHVRPDATG
ncbi:MAG: DUF2007 domain-containing protein [Steroidobacteraceae bacterium]|nr:DUF2007 domain-containing protein [Steroidobacteraceae bacterium]